MTNYVGLDVSQKITTLCIVDGEGHRQWRGECVTSPEQIVQAVLQHAGAGASIGIETGPRIRSRSTTRIRQCAGPSGLS
jgi:transposase